MAQHRSTTTSTCRRRAYPHHTESARPILTALLVFMTIMRSTSAFQVRTSTCLDVSRSATTPGLVRRVGSITPATSLTATSLPHQAKRSRHHKTDTVDLQGTNGGSVAKRKAFTPPDWTSLPLRRDALVQRSRDLDRIELIVGRIAMVGATSFLLKELVTGESILEQVAELFTKAT